MRAVRIEGWKAMRFISGALAVVGLLVVLIILLAVGVFAYDEARRRLVGDEFAPDRPEEDTRD